MKPSENWRPSSPRHRPRRRIRALLAGLAAMIMPASGLAVGSAPPALANPTAVPPGVAHAIPSLAAGSYEITLVTGDRVELTITDPVGRYEVQVEPAGRPGREDVTFLTQAGPAGVYVLPSDAMPAIQSGRLDRELFHVSDLAAHGMADSDAGTLPVILSFPEPAGGATRGYAADPAELAARADALPATTGAVGLASIHGAAVSVAADQAAAFWDWVRDQPAATVSLDRVAELVLDESVPLVGAPQAWDAGLDGAGTTVAVLDSGVDLSHPDLAGQIVAAESFVEGAPPQDRHGHGTHVSTTVLGTGAASDGRYTGVAPGADLLSGRVCTDAGSCPFSSMIAGMEWAAAEMGADVVSMSIGGAISDGTDELSRAVDRLTAETGALFVIAAGNNGRDVSVGLPGAADSALTVAATDKNDALAGFSSRGPRFGDFALKPDIAAPGVHITAASAAGTSLCQNDCIQPGDGPVDENYTSASGTSMATPHVAGAAAILAQQYPDWPPARLKAALMSTSTDAGHTVYQQGAGRLDVARATGQLVHTTSTNLDFGLVELPEDGQPEPAQITREVSYANQGDEPVTLALTPVLASTGDGDPPPAGALTTGDTVTVPAGGTATTTVTLDVTGIGRGRYTGSLLATDDATGTRLATPVGLVVEPPRVNLTIHTIGPDGQPVNPQATDVIDVSDQQGRATEITNLDVGVTAVRLPQGTYSVAQLASWVDDDSRRNAAWLLNPELTLTGDTELTLDARDATQLTFTTDRPSEPISMHQGFLSFYQRQSAGGAWFAAGFGTPDSSQWRLWATPTEEVTIGEFRLASHWRLGRAEVSMSVQEPAGGPLHPVLPVHSRTQIGIRPGYQPFTGTAELPVVDVGRGDPEDLEGLDLAGKLALMEADTYCL